MPSACDTTPRSGYSKRAKRVRNDAQLMQQKQVIDVPRPQVGVWMPDVGPGDDPEDAIRRSLRSSAANLPKLRG